MRQIVSKLLDFLIPSQGREGIRNQRVNRYSYDCDADSNTSMTERIGLVTTADGEGKEVGPDAASPTLFATIPIPSVSPLLCADLLGSGPALPSKDIQYAS